MGDFDFGKSEGEFPQKLDDLLNEGTRIIAESSNNQNDTVTVELTDAEIIALSQGALLFLDPEDAHTLLVKVKDAVLVQKLNGIDPSA